MWCLDIKIQARQADNYIIRWWDLKYGEWKMWSIEGLFVLPKI